MGHCLSGSISSLGAKVKFFSTSVLCTAIEGFDMNGLGVSLWLVDVAVLDKWKAKLGSVLMSAYEYTKSAKKVNGGKGT